MAKTLTIRIKSAAEALEGFRSTYRAIEAGRGVARRAGVYFTSIEAARSLLTPHRLDLLHAIRTTRPGSIYALAKIVGRNLKNVQEDLRLLQNYGLVQMRKGRGIGKRLVKVPRAKFGEIALRIAI